jgi:hypothetical protein
MLDQLVRDLDDVLRNREPGYAERCEDLLAQISSLEDPRSVRLLLPLFDDEAEYDELMFSIIHAIERFDDATYVREISANLPSFVERSPRWAMIVHMRILNSPSTLAAYKERTTSLSKEQQQALSELLGALCSKNVAFRPSCDALLAAL